LRARGEDALHTGEIEMATAEDAEILALAKLDARVVVTLNADFYQLLALSGASVPSVIRVRIEGLRADKVVELLAEVQAACENDLNRGAVVSVTPESIRIRRLPLF